VWAMSLRAVKTTYTHTLSQSQGRDRGTHSPSHQLSQATSKAIPIILSHRTSETRGASGRHHMGMDGFRPGHRPARGAPLPGSQSCDLDSCFFLPWPKHSPGSLVQNISTHSNSHHLDEAVRLLQLQQCGINCTVDQAVPHMSPGEKRGGALAPSLIDLIVRTFTLPEFHPEYCVSLTFHSTLEDVVIGIMFLLRLALRGPHPEEGRDNNQPSHAL
jgi:hypothetical protein